MRKTTRLCCGILACWLLLAALTLFASANEISYLEWTISEDGKVLENDLHVFTLLEQPFPVEAGDNIYYTYETHILFDGKSYKIRSAGRESEVVLLECGETLRIYATEAQQKKLNSFFEGDERYFAHNTEKKRLRASLTEEDMKKLVQPTNAETVSVPLSLLYRATSYQIYAGEQGGHLRRTLFTVYHAADGRVFVLDPSTVPDYYIGPGGKLKDSTDTISVTQNKNGDTQYLLKTIDNRHLTYGQSPLDEAEDLAKQNRTQQSQAQTQEKEPTMSETQIIMLGLFISLLCVVFTPFLTITVLGVIISASRKYKKLKEGPVLLVVGITGTILCALITPVIYILLF